MKVNFGMSEEDRSLLRQCAYREHRTQSNLIISLLHQHILDTTDIYLQSMKNELIERQTKEKQELDKQLQEMIQHQQEKDKELEEIIKQQQEKKREPPINTPQVEKKKQPETASQIPQLIVPEKTLSELDKLMVKAREIRKNPIVNE